MATIQFFFLEKTSVLTPQKRLKEFLIHKTMQHGRPISNLQIILCSDNYLLEMNEKFLNHDYFTDIITFDLGNPNDSTIEGELYISLDRVKENAKVHNVTLKSELLRVVFHGVLHLLGFKDKQKADAATMRLMEDRFLLAYDQFINT